MEMSDNQQNAALPQKWQRQVEGGQSKDLVCRPCIEAHNWLKKSVIKKKEFLFLVRTKKMTAVKK